MSDKCRVRTVRCQETWRCGFRTTTVIEGQRVELDCLSLMMKVMGRFSWRSDTPSPSYVCLWEGCWGVTVTKFLPTIGCCGGGLQGSSAPMTPYSSDGEPPYWTGLSWIQYARRTLVINPPPILLTLWYENQLLDSVSTPLVPWCRNLPLQRPGCFPPPSQTGILGHQSFTCQTF